MQIERRSTLKKIIYEISKAEKNILKKVNISHVDFINGMLAEHKKDAAEQGLELFEYIEGMSDVDGLVYHLYAYDDAEDPTMIEDFDDTIDTTDQQYKHVLKMFSVINFYQDKNED
tara:strand:+ start:130 stop:477 length:348 start_codon:yes stop_codon:yes gene_type:complete